MDRHSPDVAELYETLFENALDAVLLIQPDGRVLRANPAACRMLGSTEEEIRRAGRDEVVVSDSLLQDFLERRRLGGVVNGELTCRRADGSTFPVEAASALVTTRSGDRCGYVIFRDLGARKAAEAARAESELRLRLFVEHAPAAIAMVDREMRYLAVSRRWLTDYRLGETDVLARSHYEIFPDIPEHWKQIHRRCLEGAVESDEEPFVRADGRIDWVKWEIHPWRTATAEVGGLMMFTEVITRRKEAELALQQRHRLESIGRLAGGIAHDFNNLLTVVLSCAQAVKEDLAAGRLPPAQDVDEIAAAGRRAAELTRQLLTFARKQVVAPVTLDLNAAVGRAKALLRRILGEEYELRDRLDPATWPVRCDPIQLEQVVINLALNARDAMPAGGPIELVTRNAVVGPGGPAAPPQLAPGEYACLSVGDAGHGMTAEVRQHAFEPFFTTKPPGAGTGLGLATVYGIVEQAGGAIAVESAPGHGTTIDVFLPRDRGSPVAMAARSPRPARGSETVLVVEDEKIVRLVTARILRDAGYRVIETAGAAEALEALEREPAPPDLVVSDVVMPGLDGKALAAELRRRHPGLRVLFVSGYSDDVLGDRGVLDRDVDFLEKPFTPDALLERVRAALDAPTRA